MANTPMIEVPEMGGIPGLQWSTADQTSNGDTITTILRGKADYGALFNNEGASLLREERIGDYGWYAGHNVRHGYGRQFDEIELTAIELNVTYTNGYYSRFEAEARTESRPLEEKKEVTGVFDETYKVWWNHNIIGVETLTNLTTLQKATLKGHSSLSTAIGITGMSWAKTNQALKSGYKVFLDARFPGVQSYGVGAEQVKEVAYARTEGKAQDLIANVGYLKAPRDSAGNYYDLSRTDASKWLITSASYKKRLGWYEANITYAFAKGGWLANDAVGDATGVYPEWVS